MKNDLHEHFSKEEIANKNIEHQINFTSQEVRIKYNFWEMPDLRISVITNADRDMKKKDCSCCLSGNVN